MLLSIILPVHNNGHTIVNCVESIIGQNVKDIEIVIIENNSSDDSYNICSELAEKYSCIKLISTKEKGVSKARNIGLKNCSGEIVGFCDADDTIPNNSYARVIAAFEKNSDCNMVFCGYNVIANGNVSMRKYVISRKYRFDQVIKRVVYDPKTMGAMWNKFFKKEMLLGEEFNVNLSLCEDTNYTIRILNKQENGKAFYLNKAVYNYNINEVSATGNVRNLFDDGDNLKYLAAYDDLLLNYTLPSAMQRYIRRQKCELAIRSYLYKPVTENQKNKLKVVIRENMSQYIQLCWLTPYSTMRHLIKFVFHI